MPRIPGLPEVLQGLRVPRMSRVLREQQEGCGQMSPMACPIPHPCGLGSVGLPRTSPAIPGEQGLDKLGISHPSLPRKGGSGRERPGGAEGAGRGNQQYESLQLMGRIPTGNAFSPG